jgi:large subunit ribosomal protein LP0
MSAGADDKKVRKAAYFERLVKLLETYNKILLVGVDNVGSLQMQRIRQGLRGKGIVMMGKNTMMRKVIRGYLPNNPALEALLPYVWGNVGFVFTNGDLADIRKVIQEQRVMAPAKAGTIAPNDVIVPPGNTGLEPTQTGFLQALNIPSKISKGQIEIVNEVHLIKKGQKVGSSEATLLAKLDIKPFSYGMSITTVYDEGTVFEASLLDMTEDQVVAKFQGGVKNIACASLALGFPTIASVPHSVAHGYRNLLAVVFSGETEFTFPRAEKLKNAAAAAPVAAAAPAAAAASSAPAAAAKPAEPEPPAEEEDMGFGLFD